MRKRYLFFTTVVLLIGLMAFPTGVLAGKRIQDEGRGTVSLDSVGDAPEQATGVAKFDLDTSDDGLYRVQMELQVRNLPERAGKVFETWLKDENPEDGVEESELPIGAFQTNNDGDGSFTIKTRVNFFAPYDTIIVTAERRNDIDPNRNGDVLLRGTME